MKASVHYDDYVGTCAADIVDGLNLKDILIEWGVDTERFNPVGIHFFPLSKGMCSFSVLCEDKKSIDGKIVKIMYAKEPGYSVQNVMNLFKMFEVILTKESMMSRELENEPVLYVV